MKHQNFYLATSIKTMFFSLIVFLSPIQGLLILTGLTVMLDTVFGIYATVKLNGWKSFESNKLFNVVVKSFFYIGSIILAFLMDKHLIGNNNLFGVELLVSKICTVFWVYIEIKSIDETNIKLGRKSFSTTLKSLITGLKELKQDINELKE